MQFSLVLIQELTKLSTSSVFLMILELATFSASQCISLTDDQYSSVIDYERAVFISKFISSSVLGLEMD